MAQQTMHGTVQFKREISAFKSPKNTVKVNDVN